jgi:hypothetical protein
VDVLLPEDIKRDVLIKMVATHQYTAADHDLSPVQKLTRSNSLAFGFRQISVPELEHPKTVTAGKLDFSSELAARIKVSPLVGFNDEALIRALEHLVVHRNYTSTVMESFIAAESMASAFVYKCKLAKGVSKNKLDDYEKEMKISYIINVELPVFLHPISSEGKSAIDQFNQARKLRNDIVHEQKRPTEAEALQAINAATALVNLLAKYSPN